MKASSSSKRTFTPRSAAARRAAPDAQGERSEKKRASRGPKSSPAIPIDDDEILELEFADNKKPQKAPASESRRKVQPKNARAGGPSVKAPPLPPSLSGKGDKSKSSGTLKKGGLTDDGEDEFWQLVDD